jgi:hypothetical protein
MTAMRKLPVVPACRSGQLLIFKNELYFSRNQKRDRCRPVLAMRGASRSSRTLSAGCDGRLGAARDCLARTNGADADSEGVWFWSPDAEAKFAR